MHTQHHSFIKTSLRFTRWSRAGYAVFKSLNSAVTIGFLSTSISDSSLKKSVQKFINKVFINDLTEDDNTDQALTIAEINELNLSFICLPLQNTDSVAQSLYLS